MSDRLTEFLKDVGVLAAATLMNVLVMWQPDMPMVGHLAVGAAVGLCIVLLSSRLLAFSAGVLAGVLAQVDVLLVVVVPTVLLAVKLGEQLARRMNRIAPHDDENCRLCRMFAVL